MIPSSRIKARVIEAAGQDGHIYTNWERDFVSVTYVSRNNWLGGSERMGARGQGSTEDEAVERLCNLLRSLRKDGAG